MLIITDLDRSNIVFDTSVVMTLPDVNSMSEME